MYKTEITTADKRETLLYEKTCKTWEEVNNALDFFQDLHFENIYIKLYKGEDMQYLGRFDNITPIKRTYKETPKKKIKTTNIIMIIEILLFPIMLLLNIVKNDK